MARKIQMTRSEATAEAADAGEAPYAIDDNLGYLVNRAARLMAQMFSRRLQRHGVALAQWAILLFLYAKDGQTQRELSRVVAIEPPTVARTIDRMVRDGLVRREPHPYDGRATRIRLTPRALALRDELAAESVAGNQLAARVLSADELETLKTLLRRVIDGLTGEEGEPPTRPADPGA
jgi:DNA-binding MarR family transcriptional regulator